MPQNQFSSLISAQDLKPTTQIKNAGARIRWAQLGLAATICLLGAQMLAAQAVTSADAVKDATPAAAVQAHDDSYVIGVDDILSISVWKEPDISRTLPVRSDGKISLPLAGEVQAAGQTPHQLELALVGKLRNYIAEPEVAVIVSEMKSQKFNILGEVNKPGTYPLTNGATVLDAIALAGGFRDFAKQKSVYVLRRGAKGGETRIPFNYKDVIQGKHAEQNVKLLSHDTIVVP
jgi:polysaccharide export outer membrane protein